MLNEKDLNNQNLFEKDSEVENKDINASNDNLKEVEETNELFDYKSVEVVYDENKEPIIQENTDSLETEFIEETNSNVEEIDSNNQAEDTTNIEESSDIEEIINKEETLDISEEINVEKDNKESVDNCDEEDLDPSVKRFIDMDVINYDVHKLIYSNQFFSAKEIAQTIKKELNVNTYDELIKTIKGSKYNKLLEVLGYFLYFTYKNELSDDKKDNVLTELNNEEIICVYSFAISVANEHKEKRIAKALYIDLKNVPYDGGFILKFAAMIIKNHLKDEYDSNDKKKKKIKKLVKKCKRHIKKYDVYSDVDEAIIRYIFNVYGEYYIKKCKKLYKKIENKISVQLKINCLLSLAKGYLKKTSYNKANKYFKKVILLDCENYEAMIGNLLVLNKCYSLEELLSKKKLNKIKGYENFKSVINNSTNDGLVAKSQEITIKEKQAKQVYLDEKLKNLGKHISVISITLAFILLLLNVFIKNTGVSVVSYLLLGIFVGSSCITTNIKSNIKSIIIKVIITVIMIVLSLIF